MRPIETIDVPQANSLTAVGNLLALVQSGVQEKERLSRELRLVPREVDYYMHAARILGFANYEGRSGTFDLTAAGEKYLSAETPIEKRALLAAAVRESPVFRELEKMFIERELDKDKVVQFLRDRTNLNTVTARRRADTILSWIKQTPT